MQSLPCQFVLKINNVIVRDENRTCRALLVSMPTSYTVLFMHERYNIPFQATHLNYNPNFSLTSLTMNHYVNIEFIQVRGKVYEVESNTAHKL
jgi:hypothetical protein